MGQFDRMLWRVLGFLLLLIAGGSWALSQSAHISLAEGFYQTLLLLLNRYDPRIYITPTTRAIQIVIILSSLGVAAYLIKWFAEYMIGLNEAVVKRRMQSQVNKLKHHYIVCGLGRVGAQVAKELANEATPFVGLDRDQAKVDELLTQGHLAICADSTFEDALKQAGVGQAAALISCLGEDSQNLFVTLAARSLNSHLHIVARANRPESELKLKQAGADRVAMPYQIGGYHMANMALRPGVVDYIDIVTGGNSAKDLMVEEMVVGDESKLAGHHLGNGLAEGKMGATVIAINGVDGTNTMHPTGREVIYPGDRLIVLGDKADLSSAAALIR